MQLWFSLSQYQGLDGVLNFRSEDGILPASEAYITAPSAWLFRHADHITPAQLFPLSTRRTRKCRPLSPTCPSGRGHRRQRRSCPGLISRSLI